MKPCCKVLPKTVIHKICLDASSVVMESVGIHSSLYIYIKSGVGETQREKSDGENEMEWEWNLFTFLLLFLSESRLSCCFKPKRLYVCYLVRFRLTAKPYQLIKLWYYCVIMRTFMGFWFGNDVAWTLTSLFLKRFATIYLLHVLH